MGSREAHTSSSKAVWKSLGWLEQLTPWKYGREIYCIQNERDVFKGSPSCYIMLYQYLDLPFLQDFLVHPDIVSTQCPTPSLLDGSTPNTHPHRHVGHGGPGTPGRTPVTVPASYVAFPTVSCGGSCRSCQWSCQHHASSLSVETVGSFPW